MRYADCVKLLPHIGRDYGSTNRRILIMGESAYSKNENERNKYIVQRQVEGILNGWWTHPYFTKIWESFHEGSSYEDLGKLENTLPKRDFWESVCYWEYLQHIMREPREYVSPEYWEESKPAFISVCRNLAPDIVLCIGYETFNHLAEADNEWSVDEEMKIKEYNFTGKPMYVCRIKHPSAPGFSPREWFYKFNDFLNKIDM